MHQMHESRSFLHRPRCTRRPPPSPPNLPTHGVSHSLYDSSFPCHRSKKTIQWLGPAWPCSHVQDINAAKWCAEARTHQAKPHEGRSYLCLFKT